MIKKLEKTMVISDLHGSFIDKKAYSVAMEYMQDYKPDNVVINGDLLDFWSLSTFDRNPERKYDLQKELYQGRQIFDDIRKVVGKKAKIYYLEGNHEARLLKFIWRNPELEGVDALKLPQLLECNKYDVKFLGADPSYWKKTNGHLKIGDTIVMHGDNRLNGASTSKHSGYSAKNTMTTMLSSVVIGHNHRLAHIKQRTPTSLLTGIESGCLCQLTGTANWMQGFVTFETYRKKNYNYNLHHIENGLLVEDKKVYTGKNWKRK